MSAAPEIDGFVGIARPGEEAAGPELSAGAKRYTAALRAHLAYLQREGATGAAVNAANSDGLDRLIRRLYDVAASAHYARHGATTKRVALVAVGGYARREMSIGSDVDLLVLEDEGAEDLSAHIAQSVQTALWDAGLQVGAAVRTAGDSVSLAQSDVATQTALLAARFLAGDATLFHELMRAVRERAIPELAEFAERQLAALRERHLRMGESLYLLQPNLKEGAGGLRDYHTAYWVARACERDFRDLPDLLYVGFLTESELREYQHALGFLWRVRNALHLETKRKTDQMSFELQERLAGKLGFEPDLVSGELPVERFMREYYRCARGVQTLSEIVIEQCLARVRPRPPSTSVLVEEGFRIADGQLEIPHAALLREKPLRLLLAFAVAQRHDVPLSRAARRTLREHLHLVGEALRSDPAATEVFVGILASPRRVMRSLMAMNETGLLGRYLPEWDHIVCRWQHVVYHTYTVDVHSIFLVEELRRLWQGKYKALVEDLSELVHTTEDLPMVYLGCLLHDIGKGFGGDHSAIGAELGEKCLERLQLDPERAARANFIIRHHLLMSHVAQRRDLSDPKVIVEFAQQCGDRKNLHNLYLATFADMRASSKSAWTEWRAELLRELFERTAEFLEAGGENQELALELIEGRIEQRMATAREELSAMGVANARIDAFFEMMPRRYFVSHTPPQIARHAHALLAFDPEKQRVAKTVRDMRAGFSELIVCARDQHGLYADVAGCITAAGVNILGSNVYTTRNGLALEVYRVGTPEGDEELRAARWARFEASLGLVLTGEQTVAELIAKQERPRGAGRRIASHTPPSVAIRNDVSDLFTVIDVNADDRLGLLYDLTRTLTAHELEIYVSKATTVLDQAADSFYVRSTDQKRLLDADAIERLRRDLVAVVGGDPDAPLHAHA
ncbi:MAG TPA: [protein-PII] uridylyltransferase [Myxococcota bacterium]|nr:[protein-PII] uridylyltransferase [Myxococcota bacterium]